MADDTGDRRLHWDRLLEGSALELTARALSLEPDANLVGQRVGPYVVGVWLGAGGTGEVYRATDTHLQRDVALKVLPDIFALDGDRLQRFKREAQLLASLNHPNIAAIYGFEESDSISAIALELVDGRTLAERLAQGPIALDDALPIARQVAEALEAAHDQGIVHRDLKPSNIGLRVDGTVKVLDFGLATALGLEARPADTGSIMGTPSYVSPEHVKGRPTDKRTDVWAFGAVLYEMLTGQRVFQGESGAEILSAVVQQEIDWHALPPATPIAIRRLLERCLDRDVRHRLRDIGEARIVLEAPAASRPEPSAGVEAPSVRRGGRVWPLLVSGLVGALAVAALTWLKTSPPATSSPVARFTYTLPPERSLTLPASRQIVAISPDGTRVAYVGGGGLYLRSLAELESHFLAGSEAADGGLDQPVFSPDGRAIAFWSGADRAIKTIPVSGGPPTTICQAADPYGLSWAEDGLYFAARRQGIMRVAASGGTPVLVAAVDGDAQAYGPQLLPGGRHLLFTIALGAAADRWAKARVVVQTLATGARSVVIERASDGRYVPTGHLVYLAPEGLRAVAFDARRREVVGGAIATIAGVRRASARATGAGQFAVSDTGSLIFVPGAVRRIEEGRKDIVVADRTGRVERLPLPAGPYTEVRVSPDGRRLAIAADDGKEAVIYVYDRSGASPLQRLTVGGNNRAPVWTADGTRVAFQSDREGAPAIYWQPADGSGRAERLTTPLAGEAHAPESWMPSGKGFLFSVVRGDDHSLWTFSLSDRQAVPYGDIHSSQPMGATFSPDGHWVAYASADPGSVSTAITVQPFPATGASYPLFVGRPAGAPSNSPHKPAWSPDGRELFYVPRIGDFEVVRVTTQPHFAFGNPLTLPRQFMPGPPDLRRIYDVAPDGRFLSLRSTEATVADEFDRSTIQVVLHWLPARPPD